MSRKKKQLYLAMIAVGCAALLCDRLLLSRAPESASGQENNADFSAMEDPVAQQPPLPEISFPRAIPVDTAARPIRDLFAEPDPPATGAAGSDASSPDNPAGMGRKAASEILAARNTVSAVLIQGAIKRAVVNGRVVEMDDIVDGCTVIGIQPREVRFSCDDGEARLTVPMPARKSP